MNEVKLNRQNTGNRWVTRPDGKLKVSGKLKYLTDYSFPGMIYGRILRSKYPHAIITSINVKPALQLEGVMAVITYKDIPGLNGFGLIIQDQPVFCEDRVRYIGDAIAAVAAKTEEIASTAIKLIEVAYEPLPILDNPEDAMKDDSIHLHSSGNILHRQTFDHGESIEGAFSSCYEVVEETYFTPRQMHSYMETEGGVVVPEKDGGITVYAASQHGFKDRLQLSRILDLPEELIRVVSSPIGGSFGGKDELNIQPYAALLALKTGFPVKIHQKRSDSIKAGLKRHPMKVTMKTGVNQEGEIVAHQARIIADTGAYASLGPAVLDFAVEHAVGPYMIPNVNVEGFSVYTNNGVAGEFRGFGGNQITFALESQIERLAERLKMDSIELRKKNLRKENDPGPLRQKIVPTNSAFTVLDKIQESPILKKDKSFQGKWTLRGTGCALTMHGGGLGYGRPDSSGGRLSLNEKGKIEIAFGFEEVGQGLIASIEILLTEQLNCTKEDIQITIGDTALVPHSGSSTASRATNMIWQGIKELKRPWSRLMLEATSELLNIPIEQLSIGPKGIWNSEQRVDANLVITYKELANQLEVLPSITTSYHFPTTPDPVVGGHYLYSFGAAAAEVEIDRLTGKIKVVKIDHVIAAGPVVNPMGYLGQIEGGGVMGLGFALMEDAVMENGIYQNENFDTYLIPTIKDIPLQTNVIAIETLSKGDEYGPRGVGEIGTVAIAPAITAAIYDAIGYWVTKIPINPEDILRAIQMNKIRHSHVK